MKLSMFDFPHVIMAVRTPGMSDEKESEVFDRLLNRLESNSYRTQVATGYYADSEERSVIVMFPKDEPFRRLAYLSAMACKDFSQECILYIDPRGRGFLCDDTGRMEYLGEGVVYPEGIPVTGNKTVLPDGRTITFN